MDEPAKARRWQFPTLANLGASIRFTIAVQLGVILFWSLVEIMISVFHDGEYSALGLLFVLALCTSVGFTVWIAQKPDQGGMATPATSSPGLVSMVFIDAAVLAACVIVSDQLHKPLTTPLLHLSQTLIHKLAS